jgi:hypothetical protein
MAVTVTPVPNTGLRRQSNSAVPDRGDNFVLAGAVLSYDGTTLTLSGGRVTLLDTSQDVVYSVEFDDQQFTPGSDGELFVSVTDSDPTDAVAQGSIVGPDSPVPADPKLKVGSVDTSSDTVTEVNRQPSVQAGQIDSDRIQGEQRLRAVYEANAIRAEAGIPAGYSVGVESGKSAGLSDPSALTTQTTSITIQSDSDASNFANSGSGTASDPYVIRDREIDQADLGRNTAVVIDDSNSDYHVKFINCQMTGHASDVLDLRMGGGDTSVEFEQCEIVSNSGGWCRWEGGNMTFDRLNVSNTDGGVFNLVASDSDRVTAENCTFDISGTPFSSGTTEPFDLIVKHSEFDGCNRAIREGGGAFRLTFEFNDVRNTSSFGVEFRKPFERTIRFSNFFRCGNDAIFGRDAPGAKDVEIAHCGFDASAGTRGVTLRNVTDGRIHHCQAINTQGTNNAGNESLESIDSTRVDIEYCWVEENPEDALEHVRPTDCSVRHCVTDNVTGQAVDYFNGGALGESVGGEVGYIYGDADVAVVLSALKDISVHNIFVECTNCIVLDDQNAGSVVTDNIEIYGTLPLDSSISGSRFDIDPNVGGNNVAVYYNDEGLVDESDDNPANFTPAEPEFKTIR